jgi:CBS domain-containing protein
MSKYASAKEMIDALAVARDRARIHAHLFSLEAKEQWGKIETLFLELESNLEKSGENFAATSVTSFREIVQTAKSLMRELDRSLGLEALVGSLMQKSPRTCSAGDSLNEAARVMWDLDCGAVPVLSADGQVAGIITDRDICMAAYTRGQPLSAMSIESAMSKEVHTCGPEDSIGDAMRVMAEKQVRRLPVTEDGKLVGVLTFADIARDIRRRGENPTACVALAHALASISQRNGTEEHAVAAE